MIRGEGGRGTLFINCLSMNARLSTVPQGDVLNGPSSYRFIGSLMQTCDYCIIASCFVTMHMICNNYRVKLKWGPLTLNIFCFISKLMKNDTRMLITFCIPMLMCASR